MNLTRQPVRQRAPKPIRSREHLRYVASQPCLVCGSQPCQAHHLKYGSEYGVMMGRRVCDTLTVPLCMFHHEMLHTMGEQVFWERFPAMVAGRLAKV